MPRKARLEFDGAVYHVMDRGNRQEAIFLDDEDRRLFLKTLWQACERTGWRIHSFVLMENHYHLLLETPEANLSSGMRWLQATYTIRHNVRHGLCGHLFQGRYKAIIVDPQAETYFRTVSDYIHLNPVRVGLIEPGKPLSDYPWSSFPALIGTPGKRPAALTAERVVCGRGDSDNARGRQRYRDALEQRARDERTGPTIDEGMLKSIRRGWFLGSEEFRQELLEKFDSFSPGASPSDKKIRRHDEAEAERLIRTGMETLGIRDLSGQAKGSSVKIALAAFVKNRTVVTNLWIARRLQMGHPSRVSRYCTEAGSRKDLQKLVKQLKKAISKN